MRGEALRKAIEEGLNLFGIGCDEAKLSQICSYVESLEKWNSRMNLTGLKEIERFVRELLYDAFFLSTCMGGSSRILDLGSGSGVLAIPTAILSPETIVMSVDKSLKKVQFQRHVRRLLSLENLLVLHGRIEDLEPLDADLLVAKAFGSTAEVLAKGGKHLSPGGRAFLVRGKSEEPVEEDGFELLEKRMYRLPKGDKEYQLFVYKKVP